MNLDAGNQAVATIVDTSVPAAPDPGGEADAANQGGMLALAKNGGGTLTLAVPTATPAAPPSTAAPWLPATIRRLARARGDGRRQTMMHRRATAGISNNMG